MRPVPLLAVGTLLLLPLASLPAAAAPVPPTWATYVGGPGWDEVDDMVLDPAGNAYLAGTTNYYGEPCCRDDTWVAKYAPDGRRAWRVDVGGPRAEYGLSIAYRAGVLVVGGTGQGDFPTTPGAWMTTGDADNFVARLDPATGAVRWATLVPAGVDALDVDDAGNVYVAGATGSCALPTTSSAYQPAHADGCPGPSDAYALKLSSDGARAIYLTYLGGHGGDAVDAIAVSPSSGSLLLAGWTTSPDFDVTAGAFDTTHNGEGDAFVVKLDASGSRVLFGTYLGGPGGDHAFGIARDASSNPYVVGVTDAAGFPTTPGAHQTQFVGGDCGHSHGYRECYDAFVVKLDSSGASLRYATLLAADSDDWADDVAVDGTGAAHVVGHTASFNFPSTDGWAMRDMDSAEPFAVAVSPSGRALLYATVLPTTGGFGAAHAVGMRSDGAAVIAGDAATFPVSPGADRTTAESHEGFLAKLGAPTSSLVFDHTGGNEWFVEVALGGREVDQVTRVEARDTGGAWAPLSKQPYGKWGGGYRVEPGNAVEFRATLASGAMRASCTFTHPGGNCTSAPPPTNGSFDATFSNVKGNEWWVEAKVTGTEPLAKVEASVNGGAWRALTLRSWGAWAASFNVPGGSIVQLRATSTTGATDLSGCYQWTSAAPVACPGGGTTPPPTNSTFDATFRNVRGNEWWVETDVSVTGGTLAGVDARVNGGTWVPLEKKSYGSWAKSIHAPTGSTVEFRARATDGSADISAAYRWPPA